MTKFCNFTIMMLCVSYICNDLAVSGKYKAMISDLFNSNIINCINFDLVVINIITFCNVNNPAIRVHHNYEKGRHNSTNH